MMFGLQKRRSGIETQKHINNFKIQHYNFAHSKQMNVLGNNNSIAAALEYE